MDLSEAVFGNSSFSKNRQRLIQHKVARTIHFSAQRRPRWLRAELRLTSKFTSAHGNPPPWDSAWVGDAWNERKRGLLKNLT
jgi:hypothetical protein